jgi:hypothetical protein
MPAFRPACRLSTKLNAKINVGTLPASERYSSCNWSSAFAPGLVRVARIDSTSGR